MNSNFTYLKETLPDLAVLGELAEQYVYVDPSSCAVKLRTYAEKYVQNLYWQLGLTLPEDNSLYSLLSGLNQHSVIQRSILDYLHILRQSGNKAAHGGELSSSEAIQLLKYAHSIGTWLNIVFLKADPCADYCFKVPKKIQEPFLEPEKVKVQIQLLKKGTQVEELLKQLQEEREKLKSLLRNKEELEFIKIKGQQVADELKYNESTTRHLLIDKMLSFVGWDIEDDGKSTDEVGQEIEVDGQPTESGIGYVDYVLWDDNGLPLAVIEVKKTSRDPDIGKKQAVLYADSLEKKFNQRPVIFCTNGHDIIIWNDSEKEPPRKIYGFYSKDSLQYLHFKRKERKKAKDIILNPAIAGRIYQQEAQRRVIEKFDSKYRKSLIAQATGTGKTRVAVSLCDALMRANWAKRILFLCDRRELRKQAKEKFTEFLPDTPLTIVNSNTSKIRDKRIYLSTYPAMLKCYDSFDVGFFDLIIADESHRSIYNIYKDIFSYFDSLQIGLTATPVEFVNRNTFSMFECDNQDPTAHYSYCQAVLDEYLVPFEVITHTTKFLRDGIRYADMNRDQQIQLEEQVADAEDFDFSAPQIDQQIFNRATIREILKNLMENGIKEETNTHPGKSIIFARNHRHAIMIQSEFNNMYRQYGGNFCQVIDNYDPRAEQLIDDFKGKGTNKNLTIAISVDMLDTGIDIPEVVNLVFAKPLKSYVKFWQMIGRGTRLCSNLFGLGKDKEKFRIFDHWGNFEWFDLNYKPVEPANSISLIERLFGERLDLAELSLDKFQEEHFTYIIGLIRKDINAVDALNTIAVKDKWNELKTVKQEAVLDRFDAKIKSILRNDILPLMKWINIRGNVEAYKFDLLIVKAQKELVIDSHEFDDYRDSILNEISLLQRNLYQVRQKHEFIDQVLSTEFWDNITIKKLEEIRRELRGIMQFKQNAGPYSDILVVIDVSEEGEDIEHKSYKPRMAGLEMVGYKDRVENVLNQMFNESTTLQKIKNGIPVKAEELNSLVSLIITKHPDVDINILYEFFPDTTGSLDLAIRRIIGLEADAVNRYFTTFVQSHPELTGNQIAFLNMLKNHISKFGAIKLEKFYEQPFTNINSDGIDGVFEKEPIIKEIFQILEDNRLSINPMRDA
ncbi:DUF4145 domain-containing protein [Bacteroidetes/Chlorobi group bacterium ChocPot_Mid]|nr:MAG: DUF4145 domain-containing protein [Bacteroidetes/Chlorobi group bacterium ChocPot_Mid]